MRRSVAVELLAQRGEALVGCERAALGGVLGRVRQRSVVALGALAGRGRGGLRLGGSGLLLGDERLVRLPALVRLGVLGLPGLALGIEALAPLLGLRVEALGVLVVAVLVVFGGHAVQRR